jgi:DNA-binding response OmpR family regulator
MGRILLADDDELIAEVVTDAFMSAGHAVGWMQDGKQALEALKRRPFDLLILDCNMPEMSGINLLRELRRSSTLYGIPVLALTGRQSEADEHILRYEGADDYMRKPFDPRSLVGRAEALMGGKHTRT